jgi:hypothetical protein
MHYGYYVYTVILISLVNTPAAFQDNINYELCEYLDQLCIAFFHNIVVYLNSLEEQREHVQLIVTKFWEAGFYLKLSKCEFKIQRISFIGFIVMLKGIKIESGSVCTIVEWPEPICHRDI